MLKEVLLQESSSDVHIQNGKTKQATVIRIQSALSEVACKQNSSGLKIGIVKVQGIVV